MALVEASEGSPPKKLVGLVDSFKLSCAPLLSVEYLFQFESGQACPPCRFFVAFVSPHVRSVKSIEFNSLFAALFNKQTTFPTHCLTYEVHTGSSTYEASIPVMYTISLHILIAITAIFLHTTLAISQISAVGSKFFTSNGNQFYIKGSSSF